MTADGQLPRWEVFKQDSSTKAHAAVGSVHAADAEHALLMARSVFARRPSAVSMWLAPQWAVHQYTREQLAEGFAAPSEQLAVPARYLVFLKTSDRRSMAAYEHRGEVVASSTTAALRAAVPDEPPLGVWLVEAAAVIATDTADAEPWFAPATEKRYKQQSEYAVSVKRHPAAREES